MRYLLKIVHRGALILALAAGCVCSANADPIYCSAVSVDKNYMAIDDTEVKGCLLSRVGNLTGNPKNDLFLKAYGQV